MLVKYLTLAVSLNVGSLINLQTASKNRRIIVLEKSKKR